GGVPPPSTQTPVFNYDQAVHWPERPCSSGEVGTFYSNYWWGLYSDQDPNAFLTPAQVAFHVALFTNELAIQYPGVVPGPYYWSWSPIPGGLSANTKYLVGNTDPDDPAGNVFVGFDGAANLACDFCPPGSGGGGGSNPPTSIINPT